MNQKAGSISRQGSGPRCEILSEISSEISSEIKGRQSPQGRALPPTFEKPREERAYEREVSLGAQMCQSFCTRSADAAKPVATSFRGRVGKLKPSRHLSSLLRSALSVSIAALACSSIPPHPRVEGLDEHFSGDLTRAHVEALSGLVPRSPGSPADEWARGYLSRELHLAGLEVEEIGDAEGRHIVGRLPGRSSGGLLLVAPYAALPAPDPAEDSGAAVLLEVARVFGLESDRPYDLRFAFCEIRPVPERSAPSSGSSGPSGSGGDTDSAEGGVVDRARWVKAGRSLARGLEEGGELQDLRGVIVFDRVGAPGLRLARDLRSHPVFREIFWESASSLGFEAIFPVDGGWASADGVDLGFREWEMDRVVVLVDEAVARPDLDSLRPSGRVSAQTLEGVGVVSVEALGRIMQRLSKVDAFTP